MRKARNTSALTLGAAALMALAGCTGESPEEPGSTDGPTTSSPTTQTSPPPTTEPADAELVIPECDAMNATVQGESDAFYELQGDAGVTAHRGEVDLSVFTETVGPVAQETVAQATQVAGCTWPVHYHNIVTQYVVELPEAARDSLIESLRESVYVESTAGSAIRFDHTEPGDPGGTVVIDTDITYLFLDDVWIAIMGNGELDYAQGALDALAAANPGLL